MCARIQITPPIPLLRACFNDSSKEVERIADFLVDLNPKKAYIAIPTRPPAEKWVKSANEEALNTRASKFIVKKL